MTEADVLREVLCVVGGPHELVSLPQAVPLLARKIEVTAARDVIVDGDDVERSRVAGGIVLEPVDEACALGNFVRDFAVLALELGDELESRASGGEVADGVEREGSPERIASSRRPAEVAGQEESG